MDTRVFVGSTAVRTTGVLKWFSDARGFGCITPDVGRRDCFVHHTAIHAGGVRSLAEDDEVEFDPVEGEGVPAAANVVRLAG